MAFDTYGEKPPGADGEPRRRFELATPYGPDVAPDGLDHTLARVALRSLRTGWEAMRADQPAFFLGMTVYGSAVKGRMHARSDLDAVIFLDPDQNDALDFYYQARIANERIGHHIFPRLKEAGLGDACMHLGSFNKVEMSGRVIEEYVTEELAGKGSPNRTFIPLFSLFHLQVGSGLVPYFRRQVLDMLASHEKGEEIWQKVMRTLHHDEEKRREASIRLPQTIALARHYFNLGPELPTRTTSNN